MKNIMAFLFVIIIVTSCSTSKKTSAHNPAYINIPDSAEIVLKGYLNRSTFEKDTAFKWFAENIKYGTADPDAVKAFNANANKFSMVVFGGTWCHDSQNLLPVFYRLVDKSGYPDNKITLIAVDRAKTAPNDLHKTYNLVNVPTFIVMKDGKEVGRVVEYGKEGQIDKELGEIVNAAMGVK